MTTDEIDRGFAALEALIRTNAEAIGAEAERVRQDEAALLARMASTAARIVPIAGLEVMARGKVDGSGADLQPREPAPDVHQAGGVTGRHHVGTRAPNSVDLVGQHGGGGVGVLQTECAPEPAARLGLGELDEVQATHGAEECQRSVSHAQHPQAVAGRVIGHAVRVPGADVDHAEDVDQ